MTKTYPVFALDSNLSNVSFHEVFIQLIIVFTTAEQNNHVSNGSLFCLTSQETPGAERGSSRAPKCEKFCTCSVADTQYGNSSRLNFMMECKLQFMQTASPYCRTEINFTFVDCLCAQCFERREPGGRRLPLSVWGDEDMKGPICILQTALLRVIDWATRTWQVY